MEVNQTNDLPEDKDRSKNEQTESNQESQTNETYSETNSDENKESTIGLDTTPRVFIGNLLTFLKGILTIRSGEIKYGKVVTQTIESVEFKGYNVWILVCSIIIASVGLNIDSSAVIIGAMLISPLMGPIRGIGFGVGMNDFALVVKSLKNWGVTLGVSLVTSTIYFFVTPIDQLTDQLFLRTEPTFLDVIIAFAGGIAGVVAAVKGKNDTVIPGVAIATALMPPLCTAGYGIANAEWHYFFGAFYLFLINSLLIALSTLLIVSYLHFPKREYVDPVKEKRTKQYIYIFMFVIIAPSTYLFYQMIQRSLFSNNVQSFITEVVEKGTEGKINTNAEYSRDSSYIDVQISGDYVDQDMIKYWRKQKSAYDLEETFLNIYQGEDYSDLALKVDLIQKNNMDNKEFFKALLEKDEKYNELNDKYLLLQQNSQEKDPLDVNYLLQSFKIDYPEFKSIEISQKYGLDMTGQPDTTYALFVKYAPTVMPEEKIELKNRLIDRFDLELKVKLHSYQDSIPVIEF